MKKTIIVKIGTNILTTENGKCDLNNLRAIINQLAIIKKTYNIIIVTSGAITCGSEELEIEAKTIPQKQAAASVGQILLMKEYLQFFNHHNIRIAQVLLSKNSIKDAKNNENIINTINTLLTENDIKVTIANGRRDNIILDIINNKFIGTTIKKESK